MASRPQAFGLLFAFTQLLHSQHDKILAVLDRLPADVPSVGTFRSFISDLAMRTSAAPPVGGGVIVGPGAVSASAGTIGAQVLEA